MERTENIPASHQNSKGSISTLGQIGLLPPKGVSAEVKALEGCSPHHHHHHHHPTTILTCYRSGSRVPFTCQSLVIAYGHKRDNGLDLKFFPNLSTASRGECHRKPKLSSGPHHLRGGRLLCNCSNILCTLPGDNRGYINYP